MRLLDTRTLVLHEFFGNAIPKYAILSHRWEEGEVSFQDLQVRHVASQKAGWSKIKMLCTTAASYGFGYAWTDTCCIDKSSSAELSESLNSMYRWYQKVERCFVYLSDVRMGHKWRGFVGSADIHPEQLQHFAEIKWFTRGWTLQELIAPKQVLFYDGDWDPIGTKESLCNVITEITGIDELVLLGADPATVSVAKRMSWASKRETTREEDRAYCLLGLFDVSMPMLYGEGEKAFMRLQGEIMKNSDDESLFA